MIIKDYKSIGHMNLKIKPLILATFNLIGMDILVIFHNNVENVP